MRARQALPTLLALAFALAAAAFVAGARLLPGRQKDGSVLLANGWRITPAGRAVTVGTLPLSLAVARDGRVLTLLSGYSTEGLVVIDPGSWTVADSVPLSAAWLGLALHDGDAWVAGGTTNRVWRLAAGGGSWARADSVVLADSGADVFAGGLALSPDARRVALVGQLDDSVYLLDATPLKRVAAAATGDHPYTAIFSRDGRRLLVSNWGDSTLSVYAVDDTTLTALPALHVDPRPSAMAVSADVQGPSRTPRPTRCRSWTSNRGESRPRSPSG